MSDSVANGTPVYVDAEFARLNERVSHLENAVSTLVTDVKRLKSERDRVQEILTEVSQNPVVANMAKQMGLEI